MNTLKNGRIIGLPIQFVTVSVISILLFIYISGWTAYINVESRAQSHSDFYKGDPSRLKLSNNMDSGLVLLGVNVQDTEGDAVKYLKDFGITFPNVLDRGGQITIDYGVTGLPVTFFVSRDGRVLGRWVGTISESGLENNARLLLNTDEVRDIGMNSNKILFRQLD